MVNLEWYRTFKAIYENGTLTKASVALYASQPGVSLHLNALEAYVGKTLFERTSRRMIPTEDGKLLYAYIIDELIKLEKAEQHFKKTTQEKKASINIGMCSEMFQLIIEPEIPRLNFDLEARFGAHTDLIKDLDNGILDLVITPNKQHDKKQSVRYIPFSKEKIILIAGRKTNVSKIQEYIAKNDLKKLEAVLLDNYWYSASNEMEHFRRFWFENFQKKPSFKPNYILPSITSIIRCLADDEGLAVVPDFLCQTDIANQRVLHVWDGNANTENILYFAVQAKSQYKKEIGLLQEIFRNKMPQ
ncbi:LysR family transcriptional regulator [Corallibacter sp.]|uniref:LysR family transcriptional regulator n=1 Tax=Corallibacter sp. TaxID=2038084 RepID=UPI003AB36934